ncbi:MAG: hypothetical protein J6V98_05465 [Bacteroidales bacterium]|nr:hypothetical protein [Bacteroidales bacterium]
MKDEIKYYNAPIELYRHFLEHPNKCLDEVLDYLSAGYKSNERDNAENELGINFGNWESNHARGAKLRKNTYSRVEFSIPRNIFWDYYRNAKSDIELKCLLCYLALKSIQGKKRYYYAENAKMFRRMCGYGRKEDFEMASKNELGKLGRVFSSERNMQESGRRIREATMLQFDSFHCSMHTRGKRHFFFMIAYEDREKCMKELAAYIESKKPKKQPNDYKI